MMVRQVARQLGRLYQLPRTQTTWPYDDVLCLGLLSPALFICTHVLIPIRGIDLYPLYVYSKIVSNTELSDLMLSFLQTFP
jgi:hypothetical protein